MVGSRRALGWRIWILCFLSYAFFFSGLGNSNVTTRIALTLAVIERHELTIDPFVKETLDFAESGGRFYSDKAPGLSFLALPAAYVVAKLVNPEGRHDLWNPRPKTWTFAFALLIYFASLSTVGVLTATAAVALFHWSVSLGSSSTAAALAALTYGLATPTFGWATLFFGHSACGALLVLGFVGLSAALRPAPKRGRTWMVVAFLAGLSLGLAFDVEFPAAPAVVILGACAGAEALRARKPLRDTAWLLSIAGAGVAVMLMLLMVYNTAAFGAPLKLSYAGVQDFPGMRTGFFGISLPRPAVVTALLFGAYRGLLPLSPVLILVPIAAAFGWRDPRWRVATVASILTFLWFLCMNAGYFYWQGGYATGPRHLVPSLPLLALVLPPLWDRTSWRMRATFLLLFAVSVGLSLICASVDMEAPDKILNPMRDYLLPKFLLGDLPRFLTGRPQLPGLLVLAPLLIVWWLLASPIVNAARRELAA